MPHNLGQPFYRGLRLKSSKNLRDLVSENNITLNDLVMPIFVTEDNDKDLKIEKMPGIERKQVGHLSKYVEKLIKKGIKAIALFPKVDHEKKSHEATEAINPKNLICRCLKILSQEFPDLPIISDIALDAYTLSGHDGIVDEGGKILNDLTASKLVKMSLNFAESGSQVIAPSDMMDGKVKLIRDSLEKNHFENICILSYSAKYCSELYKPFRNALGSEKNLGDSNKGSYQLDSRNSFDAINKVKEEIKEGCDIVMVKPASFYLDIINKIKKITNVPIAAFQVSGEYYMIKYSSMKGIFNSKNLILESLNSIKRSGASLIFTYFAEEVSDWLK